MENSQQEVSTTPSPQSASPVFMSVPTFKELFREVWTFYQANVWFLALVMLVGTLVAVGPLFVVLVFYPIASMVLNYSVMAIVGVVLGLLGVLAVLWAIVGGSAAQIMLVNASFKGKTASLESLVKEAFNKKLLLRFILGTIVYGILLIIGFFLLIVPGVILLVPAMYFPYLLVKEQKPVFETIKRSWTLVRGYWWATFMRVGWLALGLSVVSLILSAFMVLGFAVSPAAGFVTIVIFGLVSAAFNILVAGPMTMVMTRRMYEVISGFKAKAESAKHKITSGEIGQIVALIVLWIIVKSMSNVAQPEKLLMEPSPFNDGYEYYDENFDEEEFQRFLDQLEAETGAR